MKVLSSIAKKILKRTASKIGLLTFRIVPGSELKSLWRLVQPYSNGHTLVRVGKPGDGGYLLPDDFEAIKYCFSPGVGDVWTFEEELGKKYGIQSLVCDGTIEKIPEFDSLRAFIPKNLGIVETERTISFETWLRSVGEEPGDLILQMDIEGGEYPILSSIDPEFLKRFRIIVIELHDLDLLAVQSSFSYQYRQLMSKLLKNFEVVHLHPNNCGGNYVAYGTTFPRVIEVTLHRKDRTKELKQAKIPHALDSANSAEMADFSDFSFLEWMR